MGQADGMWTKQFKRARKAINGALANMGRRYWETLPLGEIVTAMELLNLEMAEDFILCGRDGNCTVPLTYAGLPAPSRLVLCWHTMDSGRYEVTAYVS